MPEKMTRNVFRKKKFYPPTPHSSLKHREIKSLTKTKWLLTFCALPICFTLLDCTTPQGDVPVPVERKTLVVSAANYKAVRP